jgi:hypothetical protein
MMSSHSERNQSIQNSRHSSAMRRIQDCEDWLYYEFFPEAYAIDLVDFWSSEAVVAVVQASGFEAVKADRQHIHYQQDLRVWLDIVRRRNTCSQLMAIPDAASAAGLHRVEQELTGGSALEVRPDHLCFVTIRGQRPMAVPKSARTLHGGQLDTSI